MDVQVRKKDGRLEPFDRNKVLNGLVKSGASGAEAESITVQVEAWLPTAAMAGVINSTDLRVKVLDLLRAVNPAAAAAFEAYQKSAEPPSGVPPTAPPEVPPTGPAGPPPPPPAA